MQQAFLMSERWWDAATHGIAGVDRHHQEVVAFAARQWLDMFSPGNLLATNPVVLKRTLEQGGTNLARGLRNAIDDFSRALAGTQPPAGEIRRASCRESACQ